MKPTLGISFIGESIDISCLKADREIQYKESSQFEKEFYIEDAYNASFLVLVPKEKKMCKLEIITKIKKVFSNDILHINEFTI